jgi:hypothetical protein
VLDPRGGNLLEGCRALERGGNLAEIDLRAVGTLVRRTQGTAGP